MKIKTTVANRKDVVKAMEEIMGEKAKYLGPPTFEYRIGEFMVDREGNVGHEDELQTNEIEKKLLERGLAEGEQQMLDIDIPVEGHTAESLTNLIFMIHSKQYLIAKSVGREVLKIPNHLVERLQTEKTETLEDTIQIIKEERPTGISFLGERIRFGGFPFDTEKTAAFCTLMAMMGAAAKEQHRVQPTETIEENEKYYMRVWLVRLGLGGKGGKEVRKILLENLKGHTAFRTEADKEKWLARNGGTKTEVNGGDA
ncbi:hypothetical protein EDD76_102262 [Kineothrix alysoides]|uniref:Uncharacterized protein n=1 Tax=Kineothrix alysoides TaxID=1469948 RepID=A0A4R1R4Z3_9FIRM|nr:hypothetical protein [Kineothrix alysoides]TCL60564.1 hypothetical protein EDD76_102262 [Kineothrix alysoides]